MYASEILVKSILKKCYRRKRKFQYKQNSILVPSYNQYKKKFSVLPNKIKLDTDFFYLFGLWCSDGCKIPRFGVTNKTPELIFEFKKGLMSVFAQPNKDVVLEELYSNKPSHLIKTTKTFYLPSMHGSNCFSVYVYNSALCRVLNKLKCDIFKIAKGENAKALLAGLVDGDGTIYLRDKELQLSSGKNTENFSLWFNFLEDNFGRKPYVTSDSKNVKIRLCNSSDILVLILPYLRHPEKKKKILQLF